MLLLTANTAFWTTSNDIKWISSGHDLPRKGYSEAQSRQG